MTDTPRPGSPIHIPTPSPAPAPAARTSAPYIKPKPSSPTLWNGHSRNRAPAFPRRGEHYTKITRHCPAVNTIRCSLGFIYCGACARRYDDPHAAKRAAREADLLDRVGDDGSSPSSRRRKQGRGRVLQALGSGTVCGDKGKNENKNDSEHGAYSENESSNEACRARSYSTLYDTGLKRSCMMLQHFRPTLFANHPDKEPEEVARQYFVQRRRREERERREKEEEKEKEKKDEDPVQRLCTALVRLRISAPVGEERELKATCENREDSNDVQAPFSDRKSTLLSGMSDSEIITQLGEQMMAERRAAWQGEHGEDVDYRRDSVTSGACWANKQR